MSDAAGSGNFQSQDASDGVGGILHGGPNPIVGATVTLYTTSSIGYGLDANAVASTTTGSDGSFLLTLPTNAIACPTGAFAYVTAYGGSTGGTTTNTNVLLMVPIGACGTNYTSTNPGTGVYTNTYNGHSLWIDELTTVASAYALSNFMTVTNAGVANIGAPTNNMSTPAVGTPGVSGQAAAGLAHAFANALALVNNNTGQANIYTLSGTSEATGGAIPAAEMVLLANILQACVNSTGTTGTNTATSNDGTTCGKLFSLVTPPQSGSAVPTNTLQAIVDLARYPSPQVNTWDTNCDTAGAGSTLATTCLFNLNPAIGAYAGGLTTQPPDWSLAVVYGAGYGKNTAASGCSVASPCSGLAYPVYAALDFSDNVYVMNWNAATAASTNLIGLGFDGTPIFSTASDTINTAVSVIGTDTAGHVFGANNVASGNNHVLVYSSGTGALLSTVSLGALANPSPIMSDPFNNIYVNGTGAGSQIRELSYSAGSPPSYAVSTLLASQASSGAFQLAISPDYDIYELSASSSTLLSLVPNLNSSLATAPVFATNGSPITVSVSGTSNAAAGIAVSCTCGALVVNSNGAGTKGQVTPITKSGSGTGSTLSAGSQATLPTANGSTKYRYSEADGEGWVYTVDGEAATSGVVVYDSFDKLALGIYKGCYVVGSSCSTGTSVPVKQPTSLAIDSAGDIWVTSAGNGNLVEYIGAAAPTWPGLSMARAGLPQ